MKLPSGEWGHFIKGNWESMKSENQIIQIIDTTLRVQLTGIYPLRQPLTASILVLVAQS